MRSLPEGASSGLISSRYRRVSRLGYGPGSWSRTTICTSLEREGGRFASTIEQGPLDAEVPSCPGWTLADLATHVGGVHRWAAARGTHRRAAAPTRRVHPRPPLADWYRAGLAELLDVLRVARRRRSHLAPVPGAPRGGRVEAPPGARGDRCTGGTPSARQASHPDPIEPETASDGIDEFFELIVPRVIVRERVERLDRAFTSTAPTSPASGWCGPTTADTSSAASTPRATAAVRGPAASLLLYLYGRIDSTDEIEIIGDAAAAEAWRSLPGF